LKYTEGYIPPQLRLAQFPKELRKQLRLPPRYLKSSEAEEAWQQTSSARMIDTRFPILRFLGARAGESM